MKSDLKIKYSWDGSMIVVDSEDALLICEKGHAGEIEKVLENLKICNCTEYL